MRIEFQAAFVAFACAKSSRERRLGPRCHPFGVQKPRFTGTRALETATQTPVGPVGLLMGALW